MHRTRIRYSYRSAADPAFRLIVRSEPATMRNARWGCVQTNETKMTSR